MNKFQHGREIQLIKYVEYQKDLVMIKKTEWNCNWLVPYLLGNYMNYNHTSPRNLWHNSYIKILDLSFTLWINICIKMNLIRRQSHHKICKPYDKHQAITWLFVPSSRYFNHIHSFLNEMQPNLCSWFTNQKKLQTHE